MPWVIVRAESRWGVRVMEEIGGFQPTALRLTKPRGKAKAVVSSVPLFPTWIFWEYDEKRYGTLRDVPGVRGVVKYGNAPLWLRDEDIKVLRAMEERESTATPLELGVAVEVLGVFSGQRGLVMAAQRGDMYQVAVGGFTIAVHRNALRVV